MYVCSGIDHPENVYVYLRHGNSFENNLTYDSLMMILYILVNNIQAETSWKNVYLSYTKMYCWVNKKIKSNIYDKLHTEEGSYTWNICVFKKHLPLLKYTFHCISRTADTFQVSCITSEPSIHCLTYMPAAYFKGKVKRKIT